MFYKWVILFCFLPGFVGAQDSKSSILYQENGLWGLKNDKPITPAVYDTLVPINNTAFYIAKKHKTNISINSTGVITNKGKVILPFSYLQIIPATKNYIVKKWEHGEVLFGVVSQSNNILLNLRFKMIQSINSFWIVKSFSNEMYLYNSDGTIIKQLFADSISFSTNPQFMYLYKEGKTGLSDFFGKEIFPTEYKTIVYKNNRWKTTSFNQWQVISKSDTTLIYADSLQIWDTQTSIIGINNSYQIEHNNERVGKTYNSIKIVAPLLGITKKGVLYGAIQKNGKEILPPRYSSLYYKKGYFYGCKNHKWGLYDTLGNKKSVFEYDFIGDVNDGLFPIKRKGKWGFMNRMGKEVIHCIYDSEAHFYNGKAIISYYGAMGIINLNGDWIVKPHYKEITDYNFNFYIYRIDNQYFLKNYAGDLIYFSAHQLNFNEETIYEVRQDAKNEISSLGTKVIKDVQITEQRNSWKIIKISSKYGFIDASGLLKITYRYDSLMPFSEGLAPFKLRGKWGFINKEEQIIVQPYYTQVTSFKNGLSIITKEGKKGMINTDGTYVLNPKYESIALLKDDLWLVIENGLTGLFNSKGNTIIQAKHDCITYINNNLLIISRNGKYGAVDIKGVSVIPRVYDFIGYDIKNKLLVLKKEN